eukprot:TRINITY_DN14033_c0_g1_i1.p1 TRINITY_DN14033_c0_g1~~TRINITY_DN14033_c0_g1_i1.p1  ORF type:complete len:230 (-),score=23.56 TRINITY_DN14033_c0_g1_i1:40-729(-)
MTDQSLDDLESLLQELDTSINAKPKAVEPAPARPPAPSNAAPAVDQEKPTSPTVQPVADTSAPAPKAVAPATEANKCGRCQKALEETYIQALDKFWHPQCFTCSKCTSPLEGNFYEHETGIICQNCASSMFKCSECGQSISGSHLVFDDGRIVHPTCVQTKPCGRCQKAIPLNESHTEALDQVWHHDCFVCNRCRGPLTGQFIQLEKQPYCKTCIPSLEKEKGIKIQIS